MNLNFTMFLKYIRAPLCIFCTFMASSGYLLNNAHYNGLAFVIPASFFLCAGAYSYNNLTDRKEDVVNRKTDNPYTYNILGKLITATSFVAGFLFCFILSHISIAVYVLAVASSIIYSKFRLKKYILIKNIYTGFGVMLAFLIGAAASPISNRIIAQYFFLSFFIMILSIISDMRDYKGDKLAGINTIPVRLGFINTKNIVLLMLVCQMLFAIVMFTELLVIAPFAFIILFLVRKNSFSRAHFFGSLSFIFLTLSLLLK